MQEKKKTNHEQMMHTDASDYSEKVSLRNRRETNFMITEEGISSERHYEIGGSHYIVRSVFPSMEKQTVTDKLKHLIATEIDKNSLNLKKSAG